MRLDGRPRKCALATLLIRQAWLCRVSPRGVYTCLCVNKKEEEKRREEKRREGKGREEKRREATKPIFPFFTLTFIQLSRLSLLRLPLQSCEPGIGILAQKLGEDNPKR